MNEELIKYVLACIGEECGEVQQVIGKSLRFGLSSSRPSGGSTNLEDLVSEMHDLFAVYQMLCNYYELPSSFDSTAVKRKRNKTLSYYYRKQEGPN